MKMLSQALTQLNSNTMTQRFAHTITKVAIQILTYNKIKEEGKESKTRSFLFTFSHSLAFMNLIMIIESIAIQIIYVDV